MARYGSLSYACIPKVTGLTTYKSGTVMAGGGKGPGSKGLPREGRGPDNMGRGPRKGGVMGFAPWMGPAAAVMPRPGDMGPDGDEKGALPGRDGGPHGKHP